MSAPLVVGVVCVRPGCGHGEDLHDGICFGTACECVRFVAAAGALPVPVAPEPHDLAATFGPDETAEERQARWENAAWAAGRTVDRNALAVYMAVADAEQRKLADDWAKTVASGDEKQRRLRARVAELERPAVVRHRVGVRDSYRELAAQAREDGDYEGEAVVLQQLAEREVVWAREDELAREFAADPLAAKPYVPGPSVGASADRLARLLAPREPEGEFHAYLHHPYAKGHDRPETGSVQ